MKKRELSKRQSAKAVKYAIDAHLANKVNPREIRIPLGLRVALEALGRKYDLPIWKKKRSSSDVQNLAEELLRDFRDIMKQHGTVGEHDETVLLANLVFRCEDDLTTFPSDFYPETRRRIANGEVKHELIITPDTNLDDPSLLRHIREWQEKHRIPPPQPQPIDGRSRQLDWRPVWKWGKQHPNVTRDEIAKQLCRNPVSVRKKLEELDTEIEGGK